MRRGLAGLAGVTLVVAVMMMLWHSAPSAGQEKAGVKMTPGQVSLRIRLGLKDKENTPWPGTITVTPGSVAKLDLWRKQGPDAVEGNTWKCSTRPAPKFGGRSRTGTKTPEPPKIPISENGIIATLEGANDASEVTVTTKQGEFKFKLSDVPYGVKFNRMQGAADVERVPVSYQLTASPTEDDFPSAAVAPDGTVYVAYVAFTHGKDFAARPPLTEEPKDLSNLNEPTGGDQVFAMKLSRGEWSAPMPLTRGGEDIYKTAVAVDGGGRAWVFWSTQVDSNFDLYASSFKDGSWSAPVRLTTDSGSDINPAAATDSTGRVWVAWQGFRGNNSNILVKKQDGDKFSEEVAVTTDPPNEWDPAIAASKTGDVSVAWDTYAKGDYDVYFRTAKGGGEFGPAVPVAATLKFEGRASLAYDGAGRLWVAWEEGPEKWGKDWGAYAKDKGIGLYGGPRTVAVKCFEGDKPFKTAGALADALPSFAGTLGPKPGNPQERKPGQERRGQWGQPYSLPRLATDASGRVWLACRVPTLNFWSPVGTAWFEFVTCYEGGTWLKAVFVPNSDNILDNRPPLLSLPDGNLLVIGSSDGRQKFHRFKKGPQAPGEEMPKADPVNNNLFVADFGLKTGPGTTPKLEPIPPEVPAQPLASSEREDAARMRAARMEADGKTHQLMRGDFHRHTEISGDGRGDGMLVDMWRYALDAASMDWIGNGDHDNGNGREYSWWITQKTTEAFKVGETFVPMFTYERSVSYPDGHRNVVWAKRGVRTLQRLSKEAGFVVGTGKDEQQPAHTPDTLLLYKYLAQFDGICASHTSGTDMGTDWRDNNPKVEPVVEIYQGCRQNYEEPKAPRAPTEEDAIGGWRPAGFVWNALAKGYRLGFQSSSDHGSTHISYCNVWVEKPTREGILEAMKKRHVYGATDNILAEAWCGQHMMGDEFEISEPPTLKVKLVSTGASKIKRVDIVKDNTYVYNLTPGKSEVEFTWTDTNPTPGKTSYYYIRGEQEDGELVWVSPMWITYKK